MQSTALDQRSRIGSDAFFSELSALLGPERCTSSIEICNRYQTATFATTQTVTAVAYPTTTGEISELFKLASKHSVYVYPVSGGRNWGLGSSVPTEEVAVVIDLSRMNKIVDFNEELSYITVEPGVTFAQVAKFLSDQQSSLFCAMIGGPGDASLIGNAMERGDGVGPHGDRAVNIAALQVVLPRGDIIETGFGAFGEFKVNALSPHAPGPDLQGIFLQSNFGIVSKMTFWLKPKPAVFHAVLYTVKSTRDIAPLTVALRKLQGQGIIQPNSSALWNVWKVLASQMQYPWGKMTGDIPPADTLRSHLPSIWKDVSWCGYIALYSGSKAHARATEREIKKALRGCVDSVLPLNSFTTTIAPLFAAPIRWLTGLDVRALINSFYRRPVALGIPMDLNVKSLYWRKKAPPKPPFDPHHDRCGLHWICQSVPFTSNDITKVEQILNDACNRYRFEPNIAFLNTSERTLRLFAVLTYDRDVTGDDQRAMNWLFEVNSELIAHGYPPFRLGIQLMKEFPVQNSAFRELFCSIKSTVDPQNIFAPNRYSYSRLSS